MGAADTRLGRVTGHAGAVRAVESKARGAGLSVSAASTTTPKARSGSSSSAWRAAVRGRTAGRYVSAAWLRRPARSESHSKAADGPLAATRPLGQAWAGHAPNRTLAAIVGDRLLRHPHRIN